MESHAQYEIIKTPRSPQQQSVSHEQDFPAEGSKHEQLPPPHLVASPVEYDLAVDRSQYDRATEINLWSLARPHMRVFHVAWLSTFPGLFGLYAIPPIMPVIKEHLGLSASDVLNSDIACVSSAMFSRVFVGPLLEFFGPQVVHSWTLFLSAIPIFASAFVTNATGLAIVRFFIGFVGCIFISSQFWTMITFAKNVIATSNAITGGLGPAGIGFAFLVLPFVNAGLASNGSISSDVAWRITIALPAVLMVLMGLIARFCTDDCPLGDYQHLKRAQKQATLEAGGRVHDDDYKVTFLDVLGNSLRAIRLVLADRNTIILMAHYAISTGAELQLNNVGALYFYEEFVKEDCTPSTAPNAPDCHVLTSRNAAVVASLFGLMNLVSRGLGGVLSDRVNRRFGVYGRIWVQFVLVFLEGAMLILFSQMTHIGASIAVFILVAWTAQTSGAATFGIVPYVNEPFTGSISGLVGGTGNFGAVIFGIIFRSTNTRSDALLIMGCLAIAVSFTGVFLTVHKRHA